MLASEIHLDIYRGASFDHEFITQRKVYNFDPAVHNDPADLQRTHAENLEYHGFEWAYVDFATDYKDAVLVIKKPWLRDGENAGEPLMTLTIAKSQIELTDQSVKVKLTPAETKKITWGEGSYELMLTTQADDVDCLSFGNINVYGEKG